MPSVSEALQRLGSMYGEAYRGSALLSDVIEVSATVETAVIDVPMVGRTRNGKKPGREDPSGTLRVHQMDSAWELELYQFQSASLAERRAARAAGTPLMRPFELTLRVDDPDALGIIAWKLEGCLLWRQTLGFAITDDLMEREYPLTWEVETPVEAFTRAKNADGTYQTPAVAVPVYSNGIRVG